MRVIVIEGTPAELQAVPQFRQLFGTQTSVVAMESVNGAGVEETSGRAAEGPSVSPELLRRALLKKPLHPNQKAVISVIYRSPDWISRADIAAQAGIGEGSIPGIMGGLGLRFASTRGWPSRIHGRPSRLVIEKERRNGMDYYRATDVFRRGVELANVLAP